MVNKNVLVVGVASVVVCFIVCVTLMNVYRAKLEHDLELEYIKAGYEQVSGTRWVKK